MRKRDQQRRRLLEEALEYLHSVLRQEWKTRPRTHELLGSDREKWLRRWVGRLGSPTLF
jgi:hypothetical protein